MNRPDTAVATPPDTVLVVYVTCPDDTIASSIAQGLVQSRDAACVSIVPQLQSTYRWQGRVETSAESLLMIKTRAGRLDNVRAAVGALHPDELPELIAVEVIDGTPQYLDWVRAETR